MVVSSELPLGSGLGSSAAFCVALAAALLAFTDTGSLDVNQKGWQSFGEKELDLVNKWAFEGEKIIHGKPSGIDNTVSAYGTPGLLLVENSIVSFYWLFWNMSFDLFSCY